MDIERPSRAGSVESNDILIMLHPAEDHVEVDLESKVFAQFGAHIEALIVETLYECGVTGAVVVARDSGALDYTIRSRVKTAVKRAKGAENE